MGFLKKIRYNSPVILTFSILSFLVLLLGYATNDRSNMLCFTVYRSSPFSLFFWIRLIGHVFGHANMQHFTGNILLLLLLGPILEEKYGSRDLAVMILIVAVFTGLVHILLFPNRGLLGASGIVFMMMILASVTGMKRGEIPLTLIVVSFVYIGQEVITGMSSYDNISHLTHILGGVCGGAFGIGIGKTRT